MNLLTRKPSPVGICLAGEDKTGASVGELSSIAHGGLNSRLIGGQHKMTVSLLNGRKNFESFSKPMRVYTKAPPFQDRLW